MSKFLMFLNSTSVQRFSSVAFALYIVICAYPRGWLAMLDAVILYLAIWLLGFNSVTPNKPA